MNSFEDIQLFDSYSSNKMSSEDRILFKARLDSDEKLRMAYNEYEMSFKRTSLPI